MEVLPQLWGYYMHDIYTDWSPRYCHSMGISLRLWQHANSLPDTDLPLFQLFLNTFQITKSGLDQIQLLKPLILRCLNIDLSCFSERFRNVRVIPHREAVSEKAGEYLKCDLFPPDIFSFQCYWSAPHKLMTYKFSIRLYKLFMINWMCFLCFYLRGKSSYQMGISLV